MSVAIKASVAGLLVVGTASGGYLIYESTRERVYLLKDMKGFSTSYANTTFGGKYGRYLLDPAYNKSGWEDAHKRLSSAKSEEFNGSGKVTEAHSTSTATALNKVCEVAFKKTYSDISSKANYLSDIWTYCSILKSEPKLVSSTEKSYSGKFGGKDGIKDNLVSVSDADKAANESFWNLRNKEFFDEISSESIGSLAQGSIFVDLYRKENRNKDVDNIREACKSAYGTTDSETDKVTDQDLKLFCYLVPEKQVN
ncbi:hypothetical protein [Candidatus Mycoplasma haematohominis]|uniref:hypothetical protein n=1 Tax=Candidatus Mycoplasma haematohominis TaxID=1494318 RepID=UPI001C0A68C2|nr:hypothetical protein [Candidatus Mycoplasma haemohominis]